MSIVRHKIEVEFHKLLFQSQLVGLAVIAGMFLLVGVVEWVNPEFFNYPYFSWEVDSSNIWKFWPLFLSGLAVNWIFTNSGKGSSEDENILGWGIKTSILAGTSEEVRFRCLSICLGMIGVIILNWILSCFLGAIVGTVLIVVGGMILFQGNNVKALWGILWIVIGGLLLFLLTQADPLLWLYSSVFMPLLSFVSFGQLDSILLGGDNLFVMGAIAANSQFRDEHKYLGPVGYFNSWIIGFVLLYATMTYGLLTAMIIHVLYDVFIVLNLYICRKLNK
ncbi:hypothetical protein ACFL16_02080 [Patescibacteria group bacterium]